MDSLLYALAEQVGASLKARSLMLVTAESCTGGWIGEAVTMVPGSSLWYDRGFITYTYISKQEMLGVSNQTLEQHGAVSEQTVKEMVAGALAASRGGVAVAVSGTAGPAGGTSDKPVGTVCLAWALARGEPVAETQQYAGDREAVRRQTVARALEGVLELIR